MTLCKREIMVKVYTAETILQAIVALTASDECAVPASVINHLAGIAVESVGEVLEELSGN